MSCKATPEHLACTACSLHTTRTQVVPGHGNIEAEIALIGEAPGATEDREGLPFVGRAGRLLDDLLVRAGIDPSAVYKENVIHCRPPGNDIKSCPDAVSRCPQLWLLPTIARLQCSNVPKSDTAYKELQACPVHGTLAPARLEEWYGGQLLRADHIDNAPGHLQEPDFVSTSSFPCISDGYSLFGSGEDSFVNKRRGLELEYAAPAYQVPYQAYVEGEIAHDETIDRSSYKEAQQEEPPGGAPAAVPVEHILPSKTPSEPSDEQNRRHTIGTYETSDQGSADVLPSASRGASNIVALASAGAARRKPDTAHKLSCTCSIPPRRLVVVVLGATAGQLYFPGKRAMELAQLARTLPSGIVVVGSPHPAYAIRGGAWVEDNIVGSLARALVYSSIGGYNE